MIVLLGDGKGCFSPGFHGAAPGATALAAGDINGDGLIDLVTARSSIQEPGYATVLLNQGDGTFSQSEYPVGVQPNVVVIQDLDGDGFPEVITGNGNGDGGTDVTILGNSNGTLQNAGSWWAYSHSLSVLVGAFETPGRPSVLAGSALMPVVRGDQ